MASYPSTSFNSRTPCGVRLSDSHTLLLVALVSIHAPRVGCDWISLRTLTTCLMFQFTHPVWGATQYLDFLPLWLGFQFTHPVWGATPSFQCVGISRDSFNSRTPCGVRQDELQEVDDLTKFQFTHPVWGATQTVAMAPAMAVVSIHAPRVGCDCWYHCVR